MSQDLPDTLLDVSIDDPRERGPDGDEASDEERLERFVFFELGDQRLAVSVDDVKTVTDPPEAVTRVPRSPPAIDGVVDFRGEITAVIEPRVHFPVAADPPADARLLVFDRSTDRQPAAMRVDNVLGVETVPESAVVGEDDVEEKTGALEHPLITGLVTVERRVGRSRAPPGEDGPVSGRRRDTGAMEEGSVAAARNRTSEEFGASVEEVREEAFESEFTVDDEQSTRPERVEPETVTETTAVLDVGRLLRASGSPANDGLTVQ